MFDIQIMIPVEFRGPEFSISFWPPKQMAVVTMPETTVNEYDSAITGEDQIRLPGQSFIMNSVTKSECMQTLSYY
jgi:hypothetical protein